MPSQWRVGILGAGSIADNVHLPVLLADPGVDVRWVADQSPTRAAALARAFRIADQPLEADLDVDVLLIAVPLVGREEWLERCAKAGIAAFVEKPFARTLAEHDRLAALLPGDRMVVGYQRRFLATNCFVGRAIDQNWFGQLREIHHSEGGRATRAGPEGYADLPVSAGGGLTLNLGCHALDLAGFLTQAASAQVVDRKILWDGAVDRALDATIILEAAHAPVRFQLSLTDLSAMPNVTRYLFERAELTVPVGPDSEIYLSRRDGGGRTKIGVRDGAFDSFQAAHRAWRDLLDVLGTGVTPCGTPASSRLATQMIEELLS